MFAGSSIVSFTGLSSRIDPSFSLGMSASRRCQDQVTGHDYADGEAWADGQGRWHLELALDDPLARLVDGVERAVADYAGEPVVVVGGKFRTDCKQGRKTRSAEDAGPVVVDAILKTGIACSVRTRLAFEHDGPPIREVRTAMQK